MKAILVALLLTAPVVATHAAETKLRDLAWPELASSKLLRAGTPTTDSTGQTFLKLDHQEAKPETVNVVTLDDPKVTTEVYAISGEVRYEGMVGDGYLEMWSHFGASDAYFSRTLGENGAMAKLTGNSEWRPFSLPFNAKGSKSHPTALDLNVHFAGKGTVYLRNVKLSQADALADLGAAKGGWWSDQTAGLIGGACGAILGCLGSLMEWLAARGKAPRFVLTTVRVLIGLGIAATALGLFAVLQKQPYAVWFALLLLGVLCLGILPFRLRRYADRFRDLELRRMSSMDVASR